MKKIIPVILITLFISSCLSPAEKISGTYHGQYTNNTIILTSATATVTKEADKSCSVTLSEPSIASLTIGGISITENNNSFALVKAGGFESLSGSVENNQLTISYAYLGGAITFVGTK